MSKVTQKAASSGRFVTKPIGRSKAAKFTAVEGMSLSKRSSDIMTNLEKSGLKGEALRGAITGKFKKK
ncbi:hypothetical protein [Salaquimonas pukyongi]|uniref:hypothetical protein n=1 Tax=Salaquimonas pukyongi TaxID=2712698 RepID=UPI00096BA079|nr:hypothetical protein [Salaquimonas pukyongi]